MTNPAVARKLTQVERDLARAIGRRCKGRTLVTGSPPPGLAARLESQGLDDVVWAEAPQDVATGGFDSVVVVGLLECVQHDRAVEVARAAYALLAEGGRLLACVTNAASAGGATALTRSSFKRLLKKVDQPKEFTDQPFDWLLMALHRDPPLDRPNADRCRVIANLCRGRVLELGCGPGHLSAAIAARGHDVHGIDMNGPKIAKARKRYPSATFQQADILTWSPQGSFETVVLAEVLEHVDAETGTRMLRRAWSMVEPGGRLIVSVPNENCIRHPNHVRELTLDTFVTGLAEFGAPRVSTEQPMRWLLASVDKDPDDGQENVR